MWDIPRATNNARASLLSANARNLAPHAEVWSDAVTASHLLNLLYNLLLCGLRRHLHHAFYKKKSEKILFKKKKLSKNLENSRTWFIIKQHKNRLINNIEQADRLPPPRTLILDFTLTHTRYLHYLQLYINRPDPITFLPVVQVDYMMILVVYYSYTLTVTLRLWPTKYRRNRINFSSFVWPVMIILKGQWGWFWRSIPLDLSSRPFIPLPRFICRRRPLPLLDPSLVFTPRCSV
jgi:hypothetical protein